MRNRLTLAKEHPRISSTAAAAPTFTADTAGPYDTLASAVDGTSWGTGAANPTSTSRYQWTCSVSGSARTQVVGSVMAGLVWDSGTSFYTRTADEDTEPSLPASTDAGAGLCTSQPQPTASLQAVWELVRTGYSGNSGWALTGTPVALYNAPTPPAPDPMATTYYGYFATGITPVTPSGPPPSPWTTNERALNVGEREWTTSCDGSPCTMPVQTNKVPVLPAYTQSTFRRTVSDTAPAGPPSGPNSGGWSGLGATPNRSFGHGRAEESSLGAVTQGAGEPAGTYGSRWRSATPERLDLGNLRRRHIGNLVG